MVGSPRWGGNGVGWGGNGTGAAQGRRQGGEDGQDGGQGEHDDQAVLERAGDEAGWCATPGATPC